MPSENSFSGSSCQTRSRRGNGSDYDMQSMASFKLARKTGTSKSPSVKKKGLNIVPANKKKVSLLGSRKAVNSQKSSKKLGANPASQQASRTSLTSN